MEIQRGHFDREIVIMLHPYYVPFLKFGQEKRFRRYADSCDGNVRIVVRRGVRFGSRNNDVTVVAHEDFTV